MHLHGKPAAKSWNHMPYPEALKWTRVALRGPKPGDVFSEMLSYWVYVVYVDDDVVEYLDGNPPCTFGRWGGNGTKRHVRTRDKFLAHFGGEQHPWVTLADRGIDVDGWAVTPRHRNRLLTSTGEGR